MCVHKIENKREENSRQPFTAEASNGTNPSYYPPILHMFSSFMAKFSVVPLLIRFGALRLKYLAFWPPGPGNANEITNKTKKDYESIFGAREEYSLCHIRPNHVLLAEYVSGFFNYSNRYPLNSQCEFVCKFYF